MPCPPLAPLADRAVLFFADVSSRSALEVLLLDDDFHVYATLGGRTIRITNRYREIVVEVPTVRALVEWMVAFQTFYGDVLRRHEAPEQAGRFHLFSESNQLRPHASFAPLRFNSDAVWMVDGQAVYASMARAILDARSEIFIAGACCFALRCVLRVRSPLRRRRWSWRLVAGWWVTPDVPLIRVAGSRFVTLADLLRMKAREGVMVYVLLYREVASALPSLRSDRAKQRLRDIHPNVRVLRHPNHLSIMNKFESAMYWSHHEKIVVVDQMIAIVGGIDLCPGRFDTADHVLADESASTFNDDDYYNPCVSGSTSCPAAVNAYVLLPASCHRRVLPR